MKENEIGFGIGNYYGGLSICNDGDKFFWSIEDYDGKYWEEITKSLYDELVRFYEIENKECE